MKKTYITIILALLTSCSSITAPVPYGLYRGMTDNSPDGTPSFKSGWKDGCESGLSAYGTLQYKAAYSYKYDETQLNNDEYHNAWRIGFRYCRWYVAEWTR